MVQGCLCQQFLSFHRLTSKFSAYRMLSVCLWSKWSRIKSRIKSKLTDTFFMFFLNRVPVCFNLFVLLYLVTSYLAEAVQPYVEWIPITFFFFCFENAFPWYLIYMGSSVELIGTFIFGFFPIIFPIHFWSWSPTFSCNAMPCSFKGQ